MTTITTNEQALAAWDAGDAITTCVMGGLSDGYEHGIHLIAMEKLRSMLEHDFDYEAHEALNDEALQRDAWDEYRKIIDATPNVAAVMEEVNPSGAMWGAAGNIATVFIRNGYAEGVAMIPADRLIQVSKTVCVLPEKVEEEKAEEVQEDA